MTGETGSSNRSELDYRIGTYATFLSRMRRLARRTPPLDVLNTSAPTDFTNALMSAWAQVCDVLTFYQERIANEGFITTARAHTSILELAGLLGVSRRPAISAQTHLTAQLIAAKGQPDSIMVTGGGGLTVQNVPLQSQPQVTFECDTPAELRMAWNAIALVADTSVDSPVIWTGCKSLRLAGTATGVRVGSALLIKARASASTLRWLVIVAQVQVDNAQGCTLVTWSQPLLLDAPATSASIFEVNLFPTTAALFGANAPEWSQLPPSKQAAASICKGGLLVLDPPASAAVDPPPKWRAFEPALPPSIDIRALATTPAGTVLAGTSAGLYRLANGSQSWVRTPLVPSTADIHAVAVSSDGTVRAGGAQGLIFCSADDGVSWSALPKMVATAASSNLLRGLLKLLGLGSGTIKLKSAWKLVSTIRTIILDEDANSPTNGQLFIGTDQGVFMMDVNAPSWTACNLGLPHITAASGAADVVVRALGFLESRLVAATSAGVFVRRGSKFRQRKSLGEAFCLAADESDADGNSMFVGTVDGVFWSSGSQWEKFGDIPLQPGRGSDQRVTGLMASGGLLTAATAQGLCQTTLASSAWRTVDQQDTDLFTVDDLASFTSALDNKIFPEPLRAFFAAWGIDLARPVSVSPTSSCWVIAEQAPVSSGGTTGPDPAVQLRFFRIAKSGSRLVVSESLSSIAPANAVAVAVATGQILAALPLGPPLNRNWPDYQIANGSIFLDRKLDGIEAGSEVMLATSGVDALPSPAVYRICSSSTVARAAFGKQSTITNLSVKPDAPLELFDLRNTVVYLAGKSLAPFAPVVPTTKPQRGDRLQLAVGPEGFSDGQALAISGRRPAAVIARMGGAFAITSSGAPQFLGLAQQSITSLATLGTTLFAVTDSLKVVGMEPDGVWRPAGHGLPRHASITCLASDPNGAPVFAGTADAGVFKRSGAGSRWLAVGIFPAGLAVVALVMTGTGTLYAATADGVFRTAGRIPPFDPLTVPWANSGLDVPVTCLTTGRDGRVYAGLKAGQIAMLAADGSAWTMLAASGVSSPVSALHCDADGTLIAAFEDGCVMRYSDADGWQPLAPLPSSAAVQTFLLSGEKLYAGSKGAGVLLLTADGWQSMLESASNDVLALAINADGIIAAGCRAAVLLNGSTGNALERNPLTTASGDGLIPALDQTLVAPGLAQRFAAAGMTLSPATVVTAIVRGRRWLVRDGDTAWMVERVEPVDAVQRANPSVTIFSADVIEVIAGPAQAGAGVWTMLLDGLSETMSAADGEIIWQPASSGQSPVSEIIHIAAAESRTAGQTRLTLTAPLANLYDPAQTTICANVIHASHGETISNEILGSGNHAQSRQHFALHRYPLTYLRHGSGAAHASLTVELNSEATRALRFGANGSAPPTSGVPWTQTPSFMFNGPSDRVYMVAPDRNGRTIVRFGDGINGARLPTGNESVTASYRAGAGIEGNVAAGKLIAMRNRPAGIRSVINPVPASGGRNAESFASLRERAPKQPWLLERIVSIDDYAAYVANMDRIAKVHVEHLTSSDGLPRICVLAATDDGRSVAEDPRLVQLITDELESKRADALPLHVGGYVPGYFRVSVSLTAAPGAQIAQLPVAVRVVLTDMFSVSRRQFGERVRPDDILKALQRLPDVLHVELDALQRVGRPTGIVELHPAPVHWDPATNSVCDPEILLLDPSAIAVKVSTP